MPINIRELERLVNQFETNVASYKNPALAYNEHSCRIEYIDPLLRVLGWDVENTRGLAPQYREVIAENYTNETDRPDYSLTLCGVPKLFVEAKKPAVDISRITEPALQTRRYGWNAGHKIAILTNFEYLVIYDTTYIPKEEDDVAVARYRIYHYSEYVNKIEEINSLISRDVVYSGDFDAYFDNVFMADVAQRMPVDKRFLIQINEWRIALSNVLYHSDEKYHSLDVLNDVVQAFINQIVFLRICEDRNLPVYHKLSETIIDEDELKNKLEELIREADRKYNSGMFSGESIIFDLDNEVISNIIKGLYYPNSPYLFNILEPNMLGKIYEMFLTEQLQINDEQVILTKKNECVNRSVVTTPVEIVKYIVKSTLAPLCTGKTPDEIKALKIADIACGSGVFLEEVFDYLQAYCVEWYISNDISHLIEVGNGRYKLPFAEKKELLCSCIYGIDIDIHAVEVSKFSLLIKLIDDESTPSVVDTNPILPALENNILHGNSLVSNDDIRDMTVTMDELLKLVPFDWNDLIFDAVIGNPPYVNTEGMHDLLPKVEMDAYKTKYRTSYMQFDKYFIFLERAIQKTKEGGYICYIIPNKFFKIKAGKELRKLISTSNLMVQLDDFADAQLFEDKTIYSSIVLLRKTNNESFKYTRVNQIAELLTESYVGQLEYNSDYITSEPWVLTTDEEFLSSLHNIGEIGVSITNHVEIFNGIQTSAERPKPIYWFSSDEIIGEDESCYMIYRNDKEYKIEKAILKPYFKPTKRIEKGLNSYSILETDKHIIFPYGVDGKLISKDVMQRDYAGAYEYLNDNYERLVPKNVDVKGVRDVPNATAETWYQYGRTQALTAFINTPKLIVGILSREAMYAFDDKDMLIASGGTAGYCAISMKEESPYAIEYIQAWMSNPYTEKILETMGSNFENGFISRGTFVLSKLPFIEINFEDEAQLRLYNKVVENTREVYAINSQLSEVHDRHSINVLTNRKNNLICEIEEIISKVYKQQF